MTYKNEFTQERRRRILGAVPEAKDCNLEHEEEKNGQEISYILVFNRLRLCRMEEGLVIEELVKVHGGLHYRD